MNDPRGSIWRIWDLHIHTPFSALNSGFPADFDEYATDLLQRAAAMQVAAVGVTDYFSAEGYKRLREILADDARLTALCGAEVAEAVRRVLFIPNIELRTSTIVRSPDGNDRRVNFHVLFSDEVTTEQIEEDFLREVKFTAEGTPSGTDEEWPLTIRNLETLGQPEENLDNESVYRMLVPCIKKAKERRQVIIVTHNPNLAVVCDADQVIYCEMDKPGGNRITYTTGAIENPVINRHIVDVLEGTRPAFDVRDAKYKLVDT